MLDFSIILTVILLFGLPVFILIRLIKRFGLSWQLALVGVVTMIILQFVQPFVLEGFFRIFYEGQTQIPSDIPNLLLISVAIGAALALLEIITRWTAFKLLKTSGDSLGFALVFGVAHAATEMILTYAIPLAINFLTLSYIAANGVGALNLSEEEAARVSDQLAQWQATPWDFYIAVLLERLMALVLSMAVTVMVWLSFRLHKFWIALAAFGWMALYLFIRSAALSLGANYWELVGILLLLTAVNLWFLYKVYRQTPDAPPLLFGRLKPEAQE